MSQPKSPRGPLWVYAYHLEPPQPRERLNALLQMLDEERTNAQLRAATWQARLVADQHVTDVLIVSDRPELGLDANRRLEAELRRLDAQFATTAPLAVIDDDAGVDPGTVGNP